MMSLEEQVTDGSTEVPETFRDFLYAKNAAHGCVEAYCLYVGKQIDRSDASAQLEAICPRDGPRRAMLGGSHAC
jgi:hypothetical protein